MNKSTFRDDLSGYIRGHVAKSIAPFRMFGIEHTSPTQNIHPSIGIVERNKREILSIIKIMSCLRLFVNSFLTDW
ncbi:hypothetical protein G807_01789 [Escherichia coli HVH 149 (4-4451880)]|nr:hypothetical protein G807_01789 [Escherichia coli HVH 149 (4-4451880)]